MGRVTEIYVPTESQFLGERSQHSGKSSLRSSAARRMPVAVREITKNRKSAANMAKSKQLLMDQRTRAVDVVGDVERPSHYPEHIAAGPEQVPGSQGPSSDYRARTGEIIHDMSGLDRPR